MIFQGEFDGETSEFKDIYKKYLNYALNQKKELWQYDVGLFDYTKRGMTYYHLAISKKPTFPWWDTPCPWMKCCRWKH